MKVVAYTAISAGKDAPRKDVICFRDYYNRFRDPVLNAKIVKVLAHQFVDADISIWIDGNVFLNQPQQTFVDLLGDADLAVFRHCERDNVFDEAKAVIRLKKDIAANVEPQMLKYLQNGWTKADLAQCSLLIRRHTPQVARLNERWMAEILCHSRRDQLSFPVVFDGVAKYLPALPMTSNQYWTRKPHQK